MKETLRLNYYEEKDKFSYFCDVTEIMKEMIGDSVKSAKVFLGYIFKEDTFEEQERDKGFFKDACARLEKSFKDDKQIEINSDKKIIITFNNNNTIEFSAMDYAFLRKK